MSDPARPRLRSRDRQPRRFMPGGRPSDRLPVRYGKPAGTASASPGNTSRQGPATNGNRRPATPGTPRRQNGHRNGLVQAGRGWLARRRDALVGSESPRGEVGEWAWADQGDAEAEQSKLRRGWGRFVRAVRTGRVPRGGAGSAPVRIARPAGYYTSRLASRRRRRWMGARMVWRLATGAELRGGARTDAGWWQRGRNCYPMGERPPHPWFFLPRGVRAIVRYAAVAAVLGLGWCWWRWPAITPYVLIRSLYLAALATAALAGWVSVHSLLLWPHRRRCVNELARTLGPEFGYPSQHPARRWLHIPPDFGSAGVESTLIVPHNFLDDRPAKERVLAILRTKLAFVGLTDVWRLTYRAHELKVRSVRKNLPARIPLGPRLRQLLDEARDSELVIAIDHKGRPIYWRLDAEAAHLAQNSESGGGKSTLLKLLGVQVRRKGGRLILSDPKRFSHGWAFHLPGVDYWRTPAQIHAGLLGLQAELERRNRIAEECVAKREPIPRFQRIVLEFDEANIAARDLRNWWRQNRTGADPIIPPALSALLTLLQAGRQVRLHVVLVTQHGTAKALGDSSGEIRESFGARVFARSGRKAWGMLAPEVSPPPPKDDTPGRVWVLVGNKRSEGQVPFLTDEEAEALALEPPPASEAPGSPGTRIHASRGEEAGDSPDVTTTGDSPTAGDTPAIGAPPEILLVTLRQASCDRGEGLVPMTLAALKKARSRAKNGRGTFPTAVVIEGQTEWFDLEDLKAHAPGRNTGEAQR